MDGFRKAKNVTNEIDPVNRYLKIPVDLCTYAFQNKLLKPFRLYITLVTYSQGNITLSHADKKLIASTLGYESTKSITNNLNMLLQLGWVGYDSNNNKYWIRGFDALRKRYKFKSRKAVEFGPEYLKDFDAFCFAAVVGRHIIYQVWRKRLALMESGRAFHDLPSRPGYFPMANIYIKNILGISISSASRYKTLAQEAGFLDRKSTLKHIEIKPHELNSCKKHDEESFGRMYVKGNRVVETWIDLIRVYLTFRRRKKIETI